MRGFGPEQDKPRIRRVTSCLALGETGSGKTIEVVRLKPDISRIIWIERLYQHSATTCPATGATGNLG